LDGTGVAEAAALAEAEADAAAELAAAEGGGTRDRVVPALVVVLCEPLPEVCVEVT
jgi:hypothetical protein